MIWRAILILWKFYESFIKYKITFPASLKKDFHDQELRPYFPVKLFWKHKTDLLNFLTLVEALIALEKTAFGFQELSPNRAIIFLTTITS